MDKAFYFDKKLKEFFVKNRDVKEQISRYNAQILPLVRGAKEVLNIQRRKFGMLFHVAINIKDYETIGHVRVIHNSVKEQIHMVENLDSYLLRVRIDEKWADAIKTFVCDKISERCMRLEKLILPDLIKMSKLNVYAYYLQTIGKTLEEDIVSHMDDDDETYYSHIMATIEQCEQTMPEETLAELNDIREKHVSAQAKRKEAAAKEKAEKKAEMRQDFEKDAVIMLQNWATDTVAIEQKANSGKNQALYSKALKKLEDLNDKLTGETLSFKLIAIARYNNRNRITPSAFRWLRVTKDGYALASGFSAATPFFDSLEPEKYADALVYCKEQGYVVATASCDITGKKEEPVAYDYYRAVPEQTWKSYRTFGDLALDDKVIYMQRLVHRTMSALKCALIIREAYCIYGMATHPMNTNADIKTLRLNLAETNDSVGCWEDESLLNSYGKYDECKALRTRLNVLRHSAVDKLTKGLNFALTDFDDRWVDVIKSVINFNSYTEEDLEILYNTLERLNQTCVLPDKFEVIKHRRSGDKTIRYFIDSRGRYRENSTGFDWNNNEITRISYVEAYLSAHEPILTKESFNM